MPNRTPVLTIENPTIDEAAEIIKTAVSERKVVIIVGNCWVSYTGRASSKLESGERIVMIKEDASVLVHRPTGYEPVNWQPAGCIFHTRAKGKSLKIRATRRKPIESVSISFDDVYLLTAMRLIDRGEFLLHASESDMQKAILFDPSIFEQGFEPISYEKKVEPGFVDVYGIDQNGKMVVIELKRKTAGREAALQLAKYVEFLKSIVNRELRGVLVAPNFAKGVQKILVSLGLEFKTLNPKKCAEILQKSNSRKLWDFFESK